MNYAEIVADWELQIEDVGKEVDSRCESRVRKLVANLSRFNINELLMGMGSWRVVHGDALFSCDDGTESLRHTGELNEWLTDCFESGQPKDLESQPKDLTTVELTCFGELYKLCEWWVDATGGYDITFVAVAFTWDLVEGHSVEHLQGSLWVLRAPGHVPTLCTPNGLYQPIPPSIDHMSAQELRAAADWVERLAK